MHDTREGWERGVRAGEAGGGERAGREQEVQALGRCQTKVAAPISGNRAASAAEPGSNKAERPGLNSLTKCSCLGFIFSPRCVRPVGDGVVVCGAAWSRVKPSLCEMCVTI